MQGFAQVTRFTCFSYANSVLSIMRFDWDSAKDERNRRERGFDFNFAALIFEGDTIEWSDERRNYDETRVRAIGKADGLLLHVVFSVCPRSSHCLA